MTYLTFRETQNELPATLKKRHTCSVEIVAGHNGHKGLTDRFRPRCTYIPIGYQGSETRIFDHINVMNLSSEIHLWKPILHKRAIYFLRISIKSTALPALDYRSVRCPLVTLS